MKEEVEDAVVEDFHDCEFQDAAEGYVDDDDLDQGEEFLSVLSLRVRTLW